MEDFWGGLFDFSGDGKTSFDEELLGRILTDELTREDETESKLPGEEDDGGEDDDR